MNEHIHVWWVTSVGGLVMEVRVAYLYHSTTTVTLTNSFATLDHQGIWMATSTDRAIDPLTLPLLLSHFGTFVIKTHGRIVLAITCREKRCM